MLVLISPVLASTVNLPSDPVDSDSAKKFCLLQEITKAAYDVHLK